MRLNTVASIFLLLLCDHALATSTPSGGDVKICQSGSIPIEHYDRFELRERGFHLSLGSPTLSAREKVTIMTERLKKFAPRRAKFYTREAEALLSDIELYRAGQSDRTVVALFRDQDLIDLPDVGQIGLPAGCRIEQLVMQEEPVLPGDRRYRINTRLFDRLTEDDVALMVFHEVAFRDLRFTHSLYARYFNEAMGSAQFESYGLKEFVDLIKASRYAEFEYMGVRFNPESARFHGNKALRSATVVDWDKFASPSGVLDVEGRMTFYDSGSVASVTAAGTLSLRILGTTCRAAPETFHPNGALAKTRLYRPCEIDFGGRTRRPPRDDRGMRLYLTSNGEAIAFEPDLEARKIEILKNVDGTPVETVRDIDALVSNPVAKPFGFLSLDRPRVQGRAAVARTSDPDDFLYYVLPNCSSCRNYDMETIFANRLCESIGLGEPVSFQSKHHTGFRAFLVDDQGIVQFGTISRGGYARSFSKVTCIGRGWYGL